MQLRVYGRALTALRMVGPLAQRIAREDRDLARQLRRAGASVVLNVAEGECADGGNRRARFDNALGSAKECIACLECGEALLYVQAERTAEVIDVYSHVIATLVKLKRR